MSTSTLICECGLRLIVVTEKGEGTSRFRCYSRACNRVHYVNGRILTFIMDEHGKPLAYNWHMERGMQHEVRR